MEFLNKFNNLPTEVKEQVSSAAVMSSINYLEQKYNVGLATVVMRVVVRDLDLDDLEKYFSDNFSMEADVARHLSDELKVAVFKNIMEGLAVVHPVAGAVENYPRSAVGAYGGSDILFSPEDEEEIRRLAKKMENDIKAAKTAEQIEQKLDEVMLATKINFGSEALADRFKQIIKTYFRGIRDRLGTKQALQKSFDSGGLDFDEESAEQVVIIADRAIKELETGAGAAAPAAPKISVPEDIQAAGKEKFESLKNIGVRDVEYDLSALENKKKEEGFVQGKPEIKSVSVPPQIDTVEKGAEEKPLRSYTVRPLGETPAENKKRMDDIKAVASSRQPLPARKSRSGVMGPLDELRDIDLINFRRLSQDPEEAADKISTKIKLLEEDDYAQKLEAVKAWRQSPVNKLYLEMGASSISQRKAVNDIINERKQSGNDYLSSQEFEAIMDLNRKLRF